MTINTIKTELKEHLKQCLEDGAINQDNFEDAHHHAFNEDYYIVYHSRALEWLKKHELDAFAAIEMVAEYQQEHFGEFLAADDINPERIVNLLTYFIGMEVTPYADTWEEFKEAVAAL